MKHVISRILDIHHARFHVLKYIFFSVMAKFTHMVQCGTWPCTICMCVNVFVCLDLQLFFLKCYSAIYSRSGTEQHRAGGQTTSCGLPFSLTVGSESVSSPPFPSVCMCVRIQVLQRAQRTHHKGEWMQMKEMAKGLCMFVWLFTSMADN